MSYWSKSQIELAEKTTKGYEFLSVDYPHRMCEIYLMKDGERIETINYRTVEKMLKHGILKITDRTHISRKFVVDDYIVGKMKDTSIKPRLWASLFNPVVS